MLRRSAVSLSLGTVLVLSHPLSSHADDPHPPARRDLPRPSSPLPSPSDQSPEARLQRGKLAYQRGDYAAAVLTLRPLLYPQTLLAQEDKPEGRKAPYQPGKPPQEQPALKGQNPLTWDAESVIEIWIRGMTRQYQLDEKQEKFTRRLLTQRVKKFLKEYERETRSLLAEYWDYQMTREMPPPEAAS